MARVGPQRHTQKNTHKYVHTHTHTHTFLRQFVSHIGSLLMMQTNAPKRRSDFPYKRNRYFGSGAGFTQTITGNILVYNSN